MGDSLRGEVKHLGVDVGVAYYSWIDTEMVRGADDHPAAQFMRTKLRGPAAKTYTSSRPARSPPRASRHARGGSSCRRASAAC